MRNSEKRKYRFNKTLMDLMARHPLTGEVTPAETLAKFLHVSERRVKDYRAGKSVPDLATAFNIALYFGVTIDFLVAGYDDYAAKCTSAHVYKQRRYKAYEQIAGLCSQVQELAISLMKSEINRQDEELLF